MCKFRKIQANNKIQKKSEKFRNATGRVRQHAEKFGSALAGSGKLQKNFRDATGRFRQNSYKFRNAPAGSGKSQRNSFDLSRRVPK